MYFRRNSKNIFQGILIGWILVYFLRENIDVDVLVYDDRLFDGKWEHSSLRIHIKSIDLNALPHLLAAILRLDIYIGFFLRNSHIQFDSVLAADFDALLHQILVVEGVDRGNYSLWVVLVLFDFVEEHHQDVFVVELCCFCHSWYVLDQEGGPLEDEDGQQVVGVG